VTARGEISPPISSINKEGVVMKIKKKIYALLLLSLLFSLLMGCGSQGTTLTGTDQDAVLAFSEAKSENLLAGMNANDYAVFSRDFDQAMLSAMTQTEFDKLKRDRDAKLGLYVSRVVNSVVQTGDFVAVIYDAKFEKDDAVTVRIVLKRCRSA
jgi:PBP1b-binding outer membrane lipoprotein LpoB